MDSYADLIAEGRADERRLVLVEREGERATVTLSDPERLNPLSAGLMLQLLDALAEVDEDPAVRAVILTGADPAFCSGGDLEMIASGTRNVRDGAREVDTTTPWRWIRNQFGGVARRIATSDKTFVAAVNGPAAGVGLAFALACDVILASDRAVLVPAFGKLGLVPEVGTSWALTRRLGYHGAYSFYLRGEHVDAERALQMGLVEEVCPHDELLATAARWCDRVIAMPPHAPEMTKALMRAAVDAPWDQSMKLEEFAEANCFSTAALEQAAAKLLDRARRAGGPDS
ncbi:MAG TPA: enoyl-CoA hydratase/isomerase family protein [Solirubrobacterales bacterium]|nr:enoyl-CoA hydratase/isomerase family protein [Solirubrobacterales bacterium]